jgi:glycosyltransferase involved in cell wall biosynthesis
MYTDTVLPRPDGIAVSLSAVTGALLRLGVSVEVTAPRGGPGGPGPSGGRRVPSVGMVGRDYRLGLVWPFAPTRRTTADGYDIVHVHSLGPVGFAGWQAARRARVPVVVTWHTDLVAYRRHYREVDLVFRLADLARRFRTAPRSGGPPLARLLDRADLVIAPTDKVRAQLVEVGCRTAVRVLPNPTLALPVPARSPDLVRSGLGIGAGAPVVLAVGRLSGEKNLPLLMTAFARVRAAVPDAHLVLVGPPRGTATLRRLARRLGIERAVSLTGTVGRDTLGAYYAMAHVLVVASLTETQCLAAHEAEAFGVPVIVTDAALVPGPSGPRVWAAPEPVALGSVIAGRLRSPPPVRTDRYPPPERYRPSAADHARELVHLYAYARHP